MDGEVERPATPRAGTEAGRLAHAEAARLRYELARLRDRRTVRTALAFGALRRAGWPAARAALRGQAPRIDVPGPAVVPLRPPFPHLRALCTGDGQLLASTCIHEQLTPRDGQALLTRDRPDLLLVDGTAGWPATTLQELAAAARANGTAVVTLGAAGSAVQDADLHLDDSDAAGVDARVWSPAGLQDAGEPHRCDDVAGCTPGDARRQPVVAVPDVTAAGVRRCLEVLAAGAVVVAGPDRRLELLLGPLADLVVGTADSVETRVRYYLDDPSVRRRVSVRLRRHVHRHHTTRQRLIAIVTELGLDTAPSERISVLLPTRRPDRLPQAVADLAASHHDDLQLVVLPHGDAALPDGLAGVDEVVRVGAERPLGAVLNAGLDVADGRYVAKVDDDDRYGSDHLGDQLLALHHSGADLVGKRIHGVYREDTDTTLEPTPGGEERFEDHLPGGTLLLPADLMRGVRWRHVPRAVDTELVRAVHLAGGSCYSTHRYGYVRVRHGDHTYDPEVAWSGRSSPGLDTSLLEA